MDFKSTFAFGISIMNFVDSLITLFLLTLLYLSAVKSAHIPKEGWRISHDGAPGYNVFSASVQKVPNFVGLREGLKEGVSTEAYQSHSERGNERDTLMVISFMEVYNKSLCQPRELLVEIAQEYPEEVEHIFIPSCVVLTRCAGCCNDEMLECTPTSTHNMTMEIKRIKPQRQENNIFMSFTEHSACECRPKKEVKEQRQNQCEPCCDGCSERRKQGFIQDPLTCQCSCRNSNAHCRARYLELNERTCRCDKPRR
ncbi:vascular endothelial growth factor A-A-like isoform X3 [Oncorhynchus nerka]|uniref:vascular endothelial growth factor Ab isoform X2 n=1 Tax=Oncorhynchus keta TaxID=8018 RepID=UPI0015FAB7E6|nr:vascular endothelial growth factor Ab isoform X2 [Oncorhynchus keta]XP_046154539.1 vascular endothelial growth factor A-A-like isoform X2 [Oncorhynchus gorbuscha]